MTQLELFPESIDDYTSDGLPDGWVWTKLGEIAKQINPGFPSGQHNNEGHGIVHIRPMNISIRGEIDLSDVRFVQREGYDALRKGDVLFNNTNSPELLGKTTYIKENTDWAYSNHMTRIRLYPDTVEPGYVAHALHYLFLIGFFKQNRTNHVNQASINSSFLADKVVTPLAPLAEQQRIVETIESLFTQLDAGVAALKRLRANLRRYKAAVLKAACEGRLVPQDPNDEPASELLERILAERHAKWEAEQRAKGKDPRKLKYDEPVAPDTSDLPELPEGWVWASMKQVGDIQLGRQRAPQHHTGDYMRPYLRVANVFEDYIDATDVFEMNFTPQEYETYLLSYNDILLNEGQSLELVGRSAIYKSEVPGACFTNTLVRFRASEGVLTEYAQLVFRAYLHSGRFQKIAKWTTNIAHLGAQRFAELEFALPSLSEQERIVTEIERLMSIVRYLELSTDYALKRAARLRQAILRQAFEGKLVPQDPNDEPASILLERIQRTRGDQPRKKTR